MRSPAEMHTIQIDITNACPNTCSNCTRFCGHHKNPFFMEFDFFKKSVDSLKDFPGIVGMIGGEPTLHPEFEKFAQYLASTRLAEPEKLCRKPIKDMSKVMHTELTQRHLHGCGLWSTLGPSYYKYFETIADTFGYQILNDHKNPCKHQGLLISWKDFDISREEWITKRDKCWIQNNWSASITPKGAFFCEVAGALDMLFDGPGGWDISDPTWWTKTPDEFGEQLQWCEICGAALDTPARYSYDGRDDISQTLLKLLEGKGSKKIDRHMYVLFDKKDKGKTFETGDSYIRSSENQRVREGQKALYPQNILTVSPDTPIKELQNKKQLDWIFVPLNGHEDYPTEISTLIFNPGCYYQYKNYWVFFNIRASSIKNIDKNTCLCDLDKFYPKDKNIILTAGDIFKNSQHTLLSKIKHILSKP